MNLHGAYFGVAEGSLFVLDPAAKEFRGVSESCVGWIANGRVANRAIRRRMVAPRRYARRYALCYAAFFFALISLRLIRHSAIWIAFSAAPLRRLSDTHHSDRPFSTVVVLADAADIGRVLAGRLIRRDVAAGLVLVDHEAARRVAQDVARLIGGDRIARTRC